MILQLKKDTQLVEIDAGELIGYKVDGHQYIHQKGRPGWRNADTEMFPIIGPTALANFQVNTPRGIAYQDQHGLLREMPYELVAHTKTTATYKKEYKAQDIITNAKYPEKSTQQELYWTYDFQFEKKFSLSENRLTVSFTITGENGMPFMLGYHPAFNLTTTNAMVEANGKSIPLKAVLDVGSRALQIGNCNELVLKDKNELRIKAEGFENFMLWTEVSNMICIEPITFYPYSVEQQNLDSGFQFLDAKEKVFKLHMFVNT